jgi:hypothetical protein
MNNLGRLVSCQPAFVFDRGMQLNSEEIETASPIM